MNAQNNIPTPVSDRIACKIGELAARWKMGDLTGEEFAEKADKEIDFLRSVERDLGAHAGILAQLKEILQNGATIKATDPKGVVLQWLPDGTMSGGLTITYKNDNLPAT